MGEATREIARHIEHTREDLGVNLRELEERVKSATDWRRRFQNNPMMMAGLAFGGGVLLATLSSGRRHSLAATSGRDSGASRATASGVGAPREKPQILETCDHIKSALVGVAIAGVKRFLGDAIPGFEEQLRKTEREPQRSPYDRAASAVSDIGAAVGSGGRNS